MAFDNVGSILRIGSLPSSAKLLLIAASSSRPRYRGLCLALLQPFTRDGEVRLRYGCYDRSMQMFLRISELQSDLLSLLELGAGDTYALDLAFQPDLVIDAGGNIGLFTLRAAAAAASIGSQPPRMVIFEPLAKNVKQIEKHLDANGIQAEIKAGCLGGERRSIPFYCREAINSSFDPQEPYIGVIDVPVYTLDDALGSSAAKRILIKLDIEGMEIEVLDRFVPGEDRPVYIVGELHNFATNCQIMERIFQDGRWTFEYTSIANDHANFRACSPAALALVPSMAAIRPLVAARA